MSTPERLPAGIDERLRDLAAFKRLNDAADIRRFANSRKIAWYVMRPATETSWPVAILDAPVYSCDGYRVYHFGR